MELDTHSEHLLPNYLDDGTAFPDVAGTALMAASAFRFALLVRSHDEVDIGPYVAWASAKFEAVVRHIDAETGIAHPVVDSLKEKREMPLGEVNPEAQAFVVLAWAARRDLTRAGVRLMGVVDRS